MSYRILSPNAFSNIVFLHPIHRDLKSVFQKLITRKRENFTKSLSVYYYANNELQA